LKKNFAILPAMLLAGAALGYAQGAVPTKIGIINVAQALANTKDGQKAGAALEAKYKPKQEALSKRQAEIQAWSEQLRKGTATMSEAAKTELQAKIDTANKALNREVEDAQAESSADQEKISQELGEKLWQIVIKYGADNGYAAILDVSNQSSNVFWFSSAIEITADIVKLYDEKYASATTAAPAGAAPAAARPATAPAAPARPATPPATKKK
jgi:outer membrane protein